MGKRIAAYLYHGILHLWMALVGRKSLSLSVLKVGKANKAIKQTTPFYHQVDARGGWGHILALDQGGASIHSKSYQGLAHLYPTRANFVNAPSAAGHLWARDGSGHTLSMQPCLLECLWKRHTTGGNYRSHAFRAWHHNSPRCTNDFRMILRQYLLWWREGEEIMTISIRRTLLAALIYEHCKHKQRRMNFYRFNLSFPITKAWL